MNERIKELADQAGLGVKHGGIVLTRNVNAAEAFEQFAELIVRDCVKLVEGYCETSPEIMGLPLEILEHFGVEINEEDNG